jgi:hypothetical protein
VPLLGENLPVTSTAGAGSVFFSLPLTPVA